MEQHTHPVGEPPAHLSRSTDRHAWIRSVVRAARRSRIVSGVSTLALSALLLGACGNPFGGPPPTPTMVVTTTPPDIADPWMDSVVRIVVAGTIVNPTIGNELEVSSGSGFIIDPSGLVITNNHVAGGAGLVRVFIPGEDEARTGRVIGVSECSDLAIVQIDGEGPFQALEWYQGSINLDLNVLKGGYPGNSETINIQRGIISQLGVDMQTEWASVSKGLLHSAKILGGDSGGVLVAEEEGRMKVVAVNFASKNADDRNYAIGRNEARKIIERLRSDVADQGVALAGAIGINGVAVTGEVGDAEISGIWVRSVISGSPADVVRLRPGDLITAMEGIPLAMDGTMQTYCEFIRERSTQPLNIEVLRLSTGELLEGQVNTKERTLTVIERGSATQLPAETATAAPATAVPIAAGINLNPTQAQIDAALNLVKQRFQGTTELLNETFDSSDSAARWSIAPAAGGFPRVHDGRLEDTPQGGTVFRGPQMNSGAGQLAGDFIIQADIAVQPGGLTSGAVIFGLSDRMISEFHIHNNGTWSLNTFDFQKAEWIRSFTTNTVPSDAATAAGTFNRLQVIHVDDTTLLIINDYLVAIMTGSPAVEGRVGIGTRKPGQEAATEVWIDNFRVIQAR